MKLEEQRYITLYKKKYGNLAGVSKKLSFDKIYAVSEDIPKALTADVPTFVRLNKTFGRLSSRKWLYLHLKNLLVRFLVDEKKMADNQIDFLADTIVVGFPSMKLTEFMLFETYFLSGKYEDFYGETSYILAITRSLQRFKKELNTLYYQIEREQENIIRSQPTKGVSWEQYCKDNGMEGKPYPGTIKEEPIKVRTVVKKPMKLTEVQVGVNSAHAVLDNTYQMDKNGVNQLRDIFRKRYGCWPEEYLAKHEEVVVEE